MVAGLKSWAKLSDIVGVSEKGLLTAKESRLSPIETTLFLFNPDSVAKSSSALAVSSKLYASLKALEKYAH